MDPRLKELYIPRRNFYRGMGRIALSAFFALLVLGFASWKNLVSPPSDFPSREIVEIPRGATLKETGNLLEERNVIRSDSFFTIYLTARGNQEKISAGTYYFLEPINALRVAMRLQKGEFGIEPVRITFPEGLSILEMRAILESNFESFDSNSFSEYAPKEEGYFFPDTYFVLPTTNAE